jgi:hypothetical protein
MAVRFSVDWIYTKKKGEINEELCNLFSSQIEDKMAVACSYMDDLRNTDKTETPETEA